jgi:hypothetical protein
MQMEVVRLIQAAANTLRSGEPSSRLRIGAIRGAIGLGAVDTCAGSTSLRREASRFASGPIFLAWQNPPPDQHQALGDLAASTGANRQISMFVRYDDCISADSRHRRRNWKCHLAMSTGQYGLTALLAEH